MHFYSIALVVLLAGCGLAGKCGTRVRPTIYQAYGPVAATSSGYSTNSKLNAAQSAENAQSQESSNKGYSKVANGYPAYGVYGGGAYAESGYDQRAKAASSSKANRYLNEEDSASGYNSGVVAPGVWAPAVVSGSGYSKNSKLNAAESSENAKSQASSNKGYSKYAPGYPVLCGGGGAYAESGYDQRAKSASSAKASRSLNKEDSASGYNQVAYPGYAVYGWA
ncbi:uncharacterized protein [Halyomorpha halys]|uniref:uncharacterized protein n=1 Tax=Halyomorpha halys TaxID=286706 RepID=UPI0006D52614|nr:uncharacterized protein LOC106679835 [Halyomorpha halys]